MSNNQDINSTVKILKNASVALGVVSALSSVTVLTKLHWSLSPLGVVLGVLAFASWDAYGGILVTERRLSRTLGNFVKPAVRRGLESTLMFGFLANNI